MRLWIDTDVGDNPDDAVALAVAVAHPDVELVGVSTVGGDHARRVRAARALTDAPVLPGDDPGLPAIVAAAAPDAVLAIGPLTNVAVWLGAWTAQGVAPPPVTVMGGAAAPVHHRGALRQVEHNFGADPAAAVAVLGARALVTVVPLDVTAAMRLGPESQGRLVTARPELTPEVEAYLTGQRARGVPASEVAVHLHDPLALLTLAEPWLVVFRARRLGVDADGRLVTGGGRTQRLVVRAYTDDATERVLTLLEGDGSRPESRE